MENYTWKDVTSITSTYKLKALIDLFKKLVDSRVCFVFRV